MVSSLKGSIGCFLGLLADGGCEYPCRGCASLAIAFDWKEIAVPGFVETGASRKLEVRALAGSQHGPLCDHQSNPDLRCGRVSGAWSSRHFASYADTIFAYDADCDRGRFDDAAGNGARLRCWSDR